MGGSHRATGQAMGNVPIDLLERERGPCVSGVAFLAPEAALRWLPLSPALGLDDVTGGRLGRIARVLLRGGQLVFQPGVLGFQFGDAGLELRLLLPQAGALLFLLALAPLVPNPSHGWGSWHRRDWKSARNGWTRFDRQGPGQGSIMASPALGLPETHPIGCRVTGARGGGQAGGA